ncbi:hypothetical protein LY78DRAFT_689969 [Colletotrichum sublineola]|nr:hypothetical protein LY78DRAFT_689969 [Colletotrichum sublineola]
MLLTAFKTILLAAVAVGVVNAQNPGQSCAKLGDYTCSGANSLECKEGSQGTLIWHLEGNCGSGQICFFNKDGNFDCKDPSANVNKLSTGVPTASWEKQKEFKRNASSQVDL